MSMALNLQVIPKLSFATALFVHYAIATTSLYIPAIGPQAVTADELGVGPDGATTWLIAPGVPSGTLSNLGFGGPATLVLGPSVAELTYIDPSLGPGVVLYDNCAIADDLAVCSAFEIIMGPGGYTTSLIMTETASAFEVQGGGATPSPTSYTPGSPSVSATAGSSVGSVPDPSNAGSGSSSAATSAPILSPGTAKSSSNVPKPTTSKANGAAKLTSLPFLSFTTAVSLAVYMIIG